MSWRVYCTPVNWIGPWIFLFFSIIWLWFTKLMFPNFLPTFWFGIAENKRCPWISSEGVITGSSSIPRRQPDCRDPDAAHASHSSRWLHLARVLCKRTPPHQLTGKRSSWQRGRPLSPNVLDQDFALQADRILSSLLLSLLWHWVRKITPPSVSPRLLLKG